MVTNDALQALMEAVERALTGLERLPSEPLPFAAAALIAVEFDAVATPTESRLSVTPDERSAPVAAALRAARAALAADGFDPQVAHDRFVELLTSIQEHRQSDRSRRASFNALWQDAIPEQFTR
ncbi:hypothetical protein, partial [Allokutzneria sp. NRRL B-24872]|uniref:hypothetical protein n=1 Tax=Allokutzneria sp. NRRL B-24872 TaxID=1137961 RepID=UPI0011775D10